MAIKVACPCGKTLAVKDELAGMKVKCPACQKLLSIPKPRIQAESLDGEGELGNSAEEDFEDGPSDAPVKSRGGKSSASRGVVSRKSSVKGQRKNSKSSNRGLLIGLSAGGGVLVIALLAWLLWPAAKVADVAGQPNGGSPGAPASETPATGGTQPAVTIAEPRYASFSEFTDGMNETLLAGMVSEGHAVPWTMPGDVSFDETFPSKENTFVDGAVMYADGSIRHQRFRDSIHRPSCRALFTIAGKESSPMSSLYPPSADTSDPTYPNPLEYARHAAARSQNKNSLREIALAFHNYHETFKHLPPATVFATDGKPLVSWRVLILPYLGESGLYKEYDQSVPWNDPKNAAVLAKMPKVYRDPLSNDPQSTLTPYLVITGPGTAFPTGTAARDMPRQANSAPNSAALAGNNPATPNASADPPPSELTGDFKALQGDWHIVEMQTDPPRPPKELETFKTVTISFVNDSMTIHIPSLASAPQPAQKIRLDSSQTPKVIDVMPPAGNANAKQLLGIYSIENDVLKLFQSPVSRPTSFVPIKGEREGIMILHRGKAAVPTGDALPKNVFDQTAWKDIEPKLKAKGIQAQLMDHRGDPDATPDGPTHSALVDLPVRQANGGIPDDLMQLLTPISHLAIRSISMSDVGLKQLSDCPELTAVAVNDRWSVTPKGLVELKKCRKLRALYLNNTSISFDHVNAIKELTALRVLHINLMPLSPEMLAVIGEKDLLLALSLQKSELTDEGLIQIAKLTKLKSLLIDSNPITDQGLQQLKTLPDLTLLSLRGLNVSPQAVDEIQKALPNCKILK